MAREPREPGNPNESILDGNALELAHQMLDASSEPVRPRDFGPYRFFENGCLGLGGMGEVWLAEEKPPGRLVAVKFLRSAWSPELRKRFVHEIEKLGQLEHNYIARLYGNGTLEDGTPWCAMEYVEGKHLDEYCSGQRLSIKDRLRLFRAVCEAVQYAHRSEIIHRDLKPSNILVKPDGTPKLLDFGIAKQLDRSDAPANPTQTELRFTRAYASPEQFRREPVRACTDVYALGVILYELLAQRPPFDLANYTPGEAERIIAEKHPERPSVRGRTVELTSRTSQTSWNDLDVLCLKAMHKDAPERYQSVEALVRDVDHYLKGEPLDARPDSLRYRMGKFARRNRRAVLATSLVFTLVIGLVVFFTLRLASARNRALAEAVRTRRIQRFMLDLFGAADKEAAPSNDLRVVTLLDRGVLEAAVLNSDPETQAELYRNLGRMYRMLGKFPRADELMRLSLEKMKSALGPENPKVADILVQMGLSQIEQAHFQDAERLIREGLNLASRHLSPDDLTVLRARSALGQMLVGSGQYDRAIAVLDPLVKRVPPGEEGWYLLLDSLPSLANAEQSTGHFDLAESLNRRALALSRQLFGNSHPRVGFELEEIAATEATLGRFPVAEGLYREAAAITTSWYGRKHPETAEYVNLLALLLIQEGKYEEAGTLLQEVLTIQEASFGQVHPNVALALDTLGTLERLRGDLAAAQNHEERAVAIDKALYGDGNHTTAVVKAHLGQVFIQERQYQRAEPVLREAVKALTERPLPGNLAVGAAQGLLGRVLLREKHYREAEGQLTAAYAILAKAPGTSYRKRLQETREDLGELYAVMQKPDQSARFRNELAANQPKSVNGPGRK